MEIMLKLNPVAMRRFQKRAETVVHHGRRHNRSWADGASESDIVAVLEVLGDDGQSAHLRWLGKYIYLGVGRGYLDLGLLGQWRLGHDVSMTRDGALLHADIAGIYTKVGFHPVCGHVKAVLDPGAVAYITDHLIGD